MKFVCSKCKKIIEGKDTLMEITGFGSFSGGGTFIPYCKECIPSEEIEKLRRKYLKEGR